MEMGARVDEVLRSGKAPGFHGLVVMRGGDVVLERYGAGVDHRLGDSLGHVEFGRDTLHDLRSVSKSVVGLLYGIALGQGLVPEPGAKLVGLFPEYEDLVGDPERAHLTVEHALTMTLGLEWDESAPYTSPANSEIAMELAPDRYRFVLERPVVEAAGERWHYCGGATAVIGGIIARGAGRPLEEYAAEVLFRPLGIEAFEWTKGGHGLVSAAAGLRLRPVDLAAIGQLVLDGGRDVVAGEWLQEMLRPRVRVRDGLDYGYQWYVGSGERDSVQGMGNGGQVLCVVPGAELVVAVNAGDYDGDASGSWAVLDAVLMG
ncbi:CubicO group peptidase, beta-lactamase class C family [Nonomuraea solani]|uniref:CubicO group peptidase, beta-lactamase class C family n=1 Tax=Nonomuraea solani TaxID=1144553 RepID=A0A1H6D2C4_9ACTN|nr:serine hydrolase [Nonomuraea solani]SEG79427.1 CubicO group peptidase, beta-lactamase class C family [Nonomuraea solani]